jgi:hypothetical protein
MGKSPKALINIRIIETNIPGMDNGTYILKNIDQYPAPRFFAASMVSSLIEANDAITISSTKGRFFQI